MLTNVETAGSLIVQYPTCSAICTALAGLVIWLVYRCQDRKPFAPLPIIGHLHIFLSRHRWGHLDWFLASSKYHSGLRSSKDSNKEGGSIDEREDDRNVTTGELSWEIKIPGMHNTIFTSDPACIKYVLVTKAKEFSKTALFAKFTQDLFGKSILLAQGPQWSRQHQAGKIFALPSTLAHIHDVLLPRGLDVMLARLDKAAATGETIDFQIWAKDLNLAVLGPMAFEVDPEILLARLAQPFDACLTHIADRFGNPLWQLTECFSASGRRYRENLAQIKALSLELVEKILERIRREEEARVEFGDVNSDERGTSLVQALLDAGVSDPEEIADALISFAIAGRDTTAHAMTWALYQLLDNPTILSDLRSSLESTPSVPAAITNDGRATILSILPLLSERFLLLSDICAESLRLHPPLPTELTQHIGKDPLVLPSGQLVLPGQIVTWSPWVMARLPSAWGDSASMFDPSRWARMRNTGEKKSVYELPTFHAGPRACLGKDLAKVIMLRSLEAIVRRYDILGVGEREGKLGVGFTGEMEGGLRVRLRTRTEWAVRSIIRPPTLRRVCV